MIRFWKLHSLSIVLAVVFVAMLVASYPLGHAMQDSNVPYWKFWLAQTIISCEADVGGALILVLFTKWFREYKSASSNDTKEERMRKE